MSEEEVPFKPIKITLSEEALDMLDAFRKVGSFRSYSMTVEECIRCLKDVSFELEVSLQKSVDTGKRLPAQEQAILLQRIGLRMRRFVRLPTTRKK